jgi:hypothetical protein
MVQCTPRPVKRSIRRTDLPRQRAYKDTVLRYKLVFKVSLVGDDVPTACIDKHEWAIQRQAPRLAAIAIRGLLELAKILSREFGIDTRNGLRRRRPNECE